MESIELGQLNENQEQFLDSLLDKADTVADKAETVANVSTVRPPTPKMSESTRIKLNHNKAQHYIENTMNKVSKGIRRGRVRFSQSSIDLEPIIHPHTQEPIKTIDIEEHRQLIDKFRRNNRLQMKRMREMSIQLERKAHQSLQNDSKNKWELKQSERMKRRNQAEERIKKLRDMKEQRLKELSASNRRLQQLSNTTLEDIYKSKFEEEFTLPAIREKDRRLEKIKQVMAPMDFQKMEEFKKSYLKEKSEMALNKRLMRQMEMEDAEYKPPSFVPASYLIAEEEERQMKLRKIQEIEREIEIAKRKDQYVKFLMENCREEAKRNRLKKKKVKEQRSASTAPLSRQETKDRGNKYFQEIRKKLKKKLESSQKQKTEIAQPEEYKMTAEERREYIEFNRKLRLEQEERIRMAKLSNIVNDQSRSDYEKNTLLQVEIDKLDRQLEKKQQLSRFRQENELDVKDTTNLVMASIEAKLAILDSVKKKSKPHSQRAIKNYRDNH